MPDGLMLILLMILLVSVYTVAKVLQLVRRSEQQWQDVDESKLREWDDED